MLMKDYDYTQDIQRNLKAPRCKSGDNFNLLDWEVVTATNVYQVSDNNNGAE